MTAEVFCTLQVEAFHRWPECPFPDVDFLKHRHRHIFHIKCTRGIAKDRGTEFIRLKRQAEKVLKDFGNEWGSMSCESMAEFLITELSLKECEVSEDGENGARVTAA